ncbi:metallophosphoesterase family protein [Lysinibacillus capsici]|uniref:metallophosphoesterase family protein n=1 Tax=Lysinibacillus capsici TaxID=2115968 RepID=UPI002E1D98AF|nr:metallophosphoesterase family protein [Lysinibacillus capsici]
MKIAILSDIHGNSEALSAVLEKCWILGITKLYVLGDTVGYYNKVSEVLEQLSLFDVTYIKGNHEEMFEKASKDELYRKKLEEKYGTAYSDTINNLNKHQIDKLFNSPYETIEFLHNKTLRFIHSKYEDWKYFYPDTPDEELQKILKEEDYLFLGHSHYEFIRKLDGKTIINVGSVGQCKTLGGAASWAIYDCKSNKVILMKTPYNREKFIEIINQSDLQKKQWLIEFLYRNN